MEKSPPSPIDDAVAGDGEDDGTPCPTAADEMLVTAYGLGGFTTVWLELSRNGETGTGANLDVCDATGVGEVGVTGIEVYVLVGEDDRPMTDVIGDGTEAAMALADCAERCTFSRNPTGVPDDSEEAAGTCFFL